MAKTEDELNSQIRALYETETARDRVGEQLNEMRGHLELANKQLMEQSGVLVDLRKHLADSVRARVDGAAQVRGRGGGIRGSLWVASPKGVGASVASLLLRWASPIVVGCASGGAASSHRTNA